LDFLADVVAAHCFLLIADAVAFVVRNQALRAHVDLVVLTVVLCLFLGVLETKLFHEGVFRGWGVFQLVFVGVHVV